MATTGALVVTVHFLPPGPEAAASSCGSGSSSYGGGTGTSDDPYLIADREHLIRLSSQTADWDKNFLQAADIDLGGCEWQPIGNLTAITPMLAGDHFSGGYDGGGFEVSGLSIGSQPGLAAGFFGAVVGDSSTFVRNLVVSGQINSDDPFIGGAVGYISGKPISKVSISSVASNFAVVSTSESRTPQPHVGGLVGEADNVLVTYTRFAGDLESDYKAANLGGLAGYLGPRGLFEDSYAIAEYSGSSTFKSGLLGWSSGELQRGYSVAGGADSGFTNQDHSAVGVFWDTSVGPASAKRRGVDVSGTTGLPTETLQLFQTYEDRDWAIVDGWAAFDPTRDQVWGICEEVNDGYPFLLWEYSSDPCPPPSSFDSGSQVGPQDPVSASEAGKPGIFLTIKARVGDPVRESEIEFGGFSVAARGFYLLTLQPVADDPPQTVLAQGTKNPGGHHEEQLMLPALSSGSYKVSLVGEGPTGELLELTNFFSIDGAGKFAFITPEELQPQVNDFATTASGYS